jgi:hypothetical protein
MRRPSLFLMDYRRWEGERQAVCRLEIEDLKGWEGWYLLFQEARKRRWSILRRRSPVVRIGSGYLSDGAVKKKPNHELETPTFQISPLYRNCARKGKGDGEATRNSDFQARLFGPGQR